MTHRTMEELEQENAKLLARVDELEQFALYIYDSSGDPLDGAEVQCRWFHEAAAKVMAETLAELRAYHAEQRRLFREAHGMPV